MENLKNNLESKFIFPSFQNEHGEIERVARTFAQDDVAGFSKKFMDIARESQLVELSEEDWKQLENTDSFEIPQGDWGAVEYHASAEQVKRDWQSLKLKMESGNEIDSAVILKSGNTLHLVSGNTRLMVARALGIRPKVLIVEMTL